MKSARLNNNENIIAKVINTGTNHSEISLNIISTPFQQYYYNGYRAK
jgi:hypothetical protein